MSKRELTFVGLSEDGLCLIVADAKGSQYSIRLDPRISAALSDPNRPAQMEIPLQPLSPKDIQARIRAGATAEEICAESGEDIERVRRFEGPPLADRAFAAEQARKCTIRGAVSGEPTLEALVAARLDERGVTVDAAHWDAWRREDGRWTVIVAFPAGTSAERVATWVYDPDARHVSPDDDEAERMVDPGAAQTIRHLPSRKGGSGAKAAAQATGARRDDPGLFSETSDTSQTVEVVEVVEVIDTASGSVIAEVVDIAEASEDRQASAPVDEPHRTDATGSEPQTASPEPAKALRKTKGKRASIPSWDEILFGGGKDDVS